MMQFECDWLILKALILSDVWIKRNNICQWPLVDLSLFHVCIGDPNLTNMQEILRKFSFTALFDMQFQSETFRVGNCTGLHRQLTKMILGWFE